ncbi:hypothetical protein HQ520_05410 [bacterium]|nr:hypothetical protein [bacterium]
MKVPQYVSAQEVQRVCRDLGIRDWTALAETDIPIREAERILAEVNVTAMPITADAFRQGLEVELEHGTRFADANVTNNHPLLTGMIVMAHLKESLEYYLRLDVAEIEGDILKAVVEKDAEKLVLKYRKLAPARRALVDAESRSFQ